MKVLRLLFEKYFSLTPQEFLSSQSRLGVLNMLKSVELFNLDNGKWVNHWINKVTSCASLLQKRGYSAQCIFSILDLQSSFSKNPLGSAEKDKIEKEAGGISESDILVGCIIKDFLNIGSSKESGQESRYGHLYTNKSKVDTLIKNTTGKYSVYFRYIALCLSGQLVPEDWWTERGDIPKTSVDYSLRRNLSNEEIKSTISQCILTVCGENDYFKWEEV